MTVLLLPPALSRATVLGEVPWQVWHRLTHTSVPVVTTAAAGVVRSSAQAAATRRAWWTTKCRNLPIDPTSTSRARRNRASPFLCRAVTERPQDNRLRSEAPCGRFRIPHIVGSLAEIDLQGLLGRARRDRPKEIALPREILRAAREQVVDRLDAIASPFRGGLHVIGEEAHAGED